MSENGDEPLLELRGIRKVFRTRSGAVRAVDGVDLRLYRGQALALVGESGSGKTTLARVAVGLDRPTEGAVRFQGLDLSTVRGDERRQLHESVGFVFQDPYASLNPTLPIWRSVEEPLVVNGRGTHTARRIAVDDLLDKVGLDPSLADSRPHTLSGGQRQRVAIARAIALDPDLVILDEPVSALDVSVQAQVLNLLRDLRDRFSLAYLFVSHDLAVVRHIADDVAVMYLGRLVEQGRIDRIFTDPAHPYTTALLSNAFDLNNTETQRVALKGDPPSPLDPPSGCRFRTRCFRARERCHTQDPELEQNRDRKVACHFPGPPTPSELGRGQSLVDANYAAFANSANEASITTVRGSTEGGEL